MIKKRLIPCVIIVVVTLGCVLLSRFTRVGFFLVLALMSAFELQNVLFAADMPTSKALMCVYIILQAIACWVHAPVIYMVALLGAAAFAAMFWGILNPDRGAKFASANLFALMWPFAFYGAILYVAASDAWLPTLTLAVLGAWACDSMALVGGKFFGKHKLAPYVSPHKTWEGTIIGGLCAILAGALIGALLGNTIQVPTGVCMLTAFAASCFGQVGDLAASLIKRMAGVKDYGHLMPEHGGIMDKTDSMLFAIPVSYLCLLILGLA